MVDDIVSHNAVESSISVKKMLRLPAGGGGTDVAHSETARLFYAVKLLQNETLVLMKNSGDQTISYFLDDPSGRRRRHPSDGNHARLTAE